MGDKKEEDLVAKLMKLRDKGLLSDERLKKLKELQQGTKKAYGGIIRYNNGNLVDMSRGQAGYNFKGVF
tara:strand:+ start:189 stop:395 length:207 start_codon:yes stop_codon:yes gene_type:complete